MAKHILANLKHNFLSSYIRFIIMFLRFSSLFFQWLDSANWYIAGQAQSWFMASIFGLNTAAAIVYYDVHIKLWEQLS